MLLVAVSAAAAAAITVLAAAPAAAGPTASLSRASRADLGRELLRRVPEWPGTQVEIPLGVYEEYVRFQKEGPTPPQPPQVAWIERAAYRLGITDGEATLTVVLDAAGLPGEGPRSVRLVPTQWPWTIACPTDRPHTIRRGDDGWFYLDMGAAAPYRVVATARITPVTTAGRHRIDLPTAPAAWSTLEVASDAAWHVRCSRSPLDVIGNAGGTQGTVGLARGETMTLAWHPPRPPVHRDARVETESHVGWTLADGVHQVRAILDVRLWGGETEQFDLTLPAGADRVHVTGPDVREVRRDAAGVRLFLRGPIRQRTRLAVTFEAPRPATGRMTLPAFGIAGSRHGGGTLAVAGGGGAVVLEMDSPGLEPMPLHDLPAATRGLLAAPPVYAYRLSGPWEARVDLVGMAEFPVRETLVDSALATVLYRPDGQVMTKMLYEVRNRARQYMAVELPAGSRLVVVRVSEEQTSAVRGPGRTILVPLEKSVLTTAGLVSFPVEIVTMQRAAPLSDRGRFRLALPRTDLPVAYARCALMLPEGMETRSWSGPLRRTDAWSSETAELEFEYGRGHLAKAPPPPPVQPVPEEEPAEKPESGPEPKPEPEPPARPEPERKPRVPTEPPATVVTAPEAPTVVVVTEEGVTEDFPRAATPDEPPPAPPDAAPEQPQPGVGFVQPATPDLPEHLVRQQQTLQAKNLYRAGVSFYRKQNYEKARDLFEQTAAAAPKSVEAANALKYIGNIDVAMGTGADKASGERGLKATAKAVQLTQQAANVDLRRRQQDLLRQAREAKRRGDERQAEAAYRVAVNLSGTLQKRGEEAREQEAVVREAEAFLNDRRAKREETAREIEELTSALGELKKSYAARSGKDADAYLEHLEVGGKVLAGKEYRDALQAFERAQKLSETKAEPRRTDGPAEGGDATFGWIAAGTGQPAAPTQAAPRQVELGEALAEQQVTATGAGSVLQFGNQAPRFDVGVAGPEADERTRDALRQEFDDLKMAYKKLASRKEDGKPEGVEVAETWDTGRAFGQVNLQVTTEAERLQAEARRVTTLAREGRIAEAERLADRLEREAHRTAAAAGVLRGKEYDTPTRAADGTFGLSVDRSSPVALEEKAERVVKRTERLPEGTRMHEDVGALEILALPEARAEETERRGEDTMHTEARKPRPPAPRGRPEGEDEVVTGLEYGAFRPEKPATEGTNYLRYPDTRDASELSLFQRAFRGAFRRALEPEGGTLAITRSRLDERIDLDFEATRLDNVLSYINEAQRGLNLVIDPAVMESGIDLSTREVYLKVKQVSIDSVLQLVLGDDLAYVPQPGHVLITTRDRLRKAAAVPSGTKDELAEVRQSLRTVAEARNELRAKARSLDRVKFSIDDLAADSNGRRLAEFVASNYAWALTPSDTDLPAVTLRDGQAVAGGVDATGVRVWTGGGTMADTDGDSFFDPTAVQVTVTADEDALVVANRPVAVERVGEVLERLRLNLGQRVGVASQNFFVDAGRARLAGIRWKQGANNVHYAVINEGQLLALMDVEQRDPSAVAGAGLPRQAYQEAVVGTGALLANGLVVDISRAGDYDNNLTYFGNTLPVTHEDYLLVDNGGYLTAVKSGRMQHWTAEVEPVRFPGVPAAVVVPAVGRTLKFEKTLLDPSDSTELVAEYTWQGEER
jgi:hypothetical protein